MKMHEIFGHISTWCAKNNMAISITKRKLIASKIKSRVIAERRRLNEKLAETSDSYQTLTHSDPTGEQAVHNVMRSLMV